MTQDKFGQIKIGDEAEIKHTITAKDIDTFASLTGDNNPLHMDKNFAAQTSYKNRVVHGMLTASFISTIIGTKLPGKGALWYEQHLRFLMPVRIGEIIKVWVKVKSKSLSQRIIILDTVIFNERRKKVVEGEAKIKVLQSVQKKEIKGIKKAKKGAVIISGSSRGIGAAIASILAKDGYPVVVNYSKSEEQAQEVVKNIIKQGGKSLAFKADVRSREEVEAMVSETLLEYGFIQGVVNNASSYPDDVNFSELKWEGIQHHIDVQIKGSFNMCQSVFPHFLEQRGGSIVNITSIVADNVPPIRWLSYSLAKSALVSFSRSLAVEFGPKGIRVNCVAPGMTETNMIADLPEKGKIITKMQTPLRKLAQPEDIANVASFLLSSKSQHLTGETIRVCGGQIML